MPFGDWTPGFEAELSNATDASTTDDEFNQRAVLVRERAKVEHDWGTVGFEGGYTDTGRHAPGSARAFLQDGPLANLPTKLRVPDNSGDQGGNSTLTAVADQGRLCVDKRNGELWYFSETGVWTRAIALGSTSGVPLNVTATSTDGNVIANGGATTTLGGWTDPLSITLPGTAAVTWEVNIVASIPIRNTSAANDRYVRCDLMQTSPAVAVPIISKEAILPQRISAQFQGITWLEYRHHTGGFGTQVFTYEFVAEVNAGADVVWGSGADELLGNGAANSRPRAQMWLRSVVL